VTPERAAGQALLDELAAGLAGIERSPMFGSSGVRRDGRLIAFVGRAGDLIVKVPRDRAEEVLAGGRAHEVRMGRGAAREWIGVPLPGSEGPGEWADLLGAAYAHAAS
jgi:hypothetical protein